MSSLPKTGLVITAHPGDFVWRAGGAIALHARRGMRVKILCLSYGERGESAKLWRVPGMTLDRVKTAREAEARLTEAEEHHRHALALNPLVPSPAVAKRLIAAYSDQEAPYFDRFT